MACGGGCSCGGPPPGDDEGPTQADLERFSGVTRPCPECGAELYDDVELCWKCGHSLRSELGRPPWWIVGVAVALLVALIMYLI